MKQLVGKHHVDVRLGVSVQAKVLVVIAWKKSETSVCELRLVVIARINLN